MMKKEKYVVTGMTCSACSSRVEKAVNKLVGIEKASVNLLTNSMQVEYDEGKLNEEAIIKAVVDAGYGAELMAEPGHVGNVSRGRGSGDKREKTEENPAVKAAREAIAEMYNRLIWSLVFLVPVLILSMTPMFAK